MEKVAEALKDYGMTLKSLGMAMDNASNNDKLLKELPNLLLTGATVGTQYQICCFGHILNLTVKAFLSLFDSCGRALKADGDNKEEIAKDTVDVEQDEDDPVDDDESFEEDKGEEHKKRA